MDNYEIEPQDYIPIFFPIGEKERIYYVNKKSETIVSVLPPICSKCALKMLESTVIKVTPSDYTAAEWDKLRHAYGIKIISEPERYFSKEDLEFKTLCHDAVIGLIIVHNQ